MKHLQLWSVAPPGKRPGKVPPGERGTGHASSPSVCRPVRVLLCRVTSGAAPSPRTSRELARRCLRSSPGDGRPRGPDPALGSQTRASRSQGRPPAPRAPRGRRPARPMPTHSGRLAGKEPGACGVSCPRRPRAARLSPPGAAHCSRDPETAGVQTDRQPDRRSREDHKAVSPPQPGEQKRDRVRVEGEGAALGSLRRTRPSCRTRSCYCNAARPDRGGGGGWAHVTGHRSAAQTPTVSKPRRAAVGT